ncbi:MAG: aminopeptidase [Spirochaetes bacterium]|nr:MAG: aminopeptidase [Spirochaetota bacterium]
MDYRKYASLLVDYCLGLGKGDALAINATPLAGPLVREVYRAALRAGAHPDTWIELAGMEKIFFDEAGPEQLSRVSPLRQLVTERYDAVLNIRAPYNLKELAAADPDRKRAASEAQAPVKDLFMRRAAAGALRWTLCEFPTEAQAQESGMSLDELSAFVESACFLDREDPAAAWRAVHDAQERAVNRLNRAGLVHYRAPGVDVSFSVKGRTWINSDGRRNMPSGEVFTSPVEDSVNGKIMFSFPAIVMGQEVRDVELEVRDGLVVRWEAGEGREFLDRIFEVPGARRFGEAAIGTNAGITRFMKNMLFDEKIGGTVHMAIGASYPETGGKNVSGVHIDLIADMRGGGEILADGELIYRDGAFLPW